MKFCVFEDSGGGHFENWALAELAVTFERYIGAHFPLKMIQLMKSIEKKGRKRWSLNYEPTKYLSIL